MKRFIVALTLILVGHSAQAAWEYQETTDKLGGGTSKVAMTRSIEPLSLGFPYQGAQYAWLYIRKHPRHGKDVFLTIERGQFLCRSYSGCPVVLSFDGGKPITIEGNEPADNDTTMIFLPIYKRLINQAKKSKRLAIGANIYHEGQPVIEFDISGLKWD